MSRTRRNIEILKHKSFRDFRNNHSIRKIEYSAKEQIEEEGFNPSNRLRHRGNSPYDSIPHVYNDIYISAIDELPKNQYMELIE